MRRSKTIEFLVMLHHLHKNSKQVDVKFTKPVHKNANTRKLITKHRLKLYYCPKTKEGKKKKWKSIMYKRNPKRDYLNKV